MKKIFPIPVYSEAFAEIVGIILGDGTISDHQLRITLDRNRDKAYAHFVANLMEEVIRERPTQRIDMNDNTISLTLSGVGLVEILESVGMQRGNKIAHQVSFPEWVSSDIEFSKACVRGLFDTDGGLYFHKKAKKNYLGWCFASASAPLLFDVAVTLQKLGFNVKKSGTRKLYMYSLKAFRDILRLLIHITPRTLLS